MQNFLRFENPSVKKLSLKWVICGMFVAQAAEEEADCLAGSELTPSTPAHTARGSALTPPLGHGQLWPVQTATSLWVRGDSLSLGKGHPRAELSRSFRLWSPECAHWLSILYCPPPHLDPPP